MKRTIVLFVAVAAFGCASAPRRIVPGSATIDAFTAAFNRHDVDAMLALADDEIEWINISGATSAIETSGKERLSASLTSYFRSCPSCSSVVEIVGANGPFVSAIEHASFVRRGAPATQSSLSVYELRNERVRRVWYFPIVR